MDYVGLHIRAINPSH